MKTLKIYRYISVLLLSSLSVALPAQTAADSTAAPRPVRGIQYGSAEDMANRLLQKDIPLFAGISVSGDLAGLVMAGVSSYGQFEAACRANLKGRYFPIVEIGWGLSDHTEETTGIHYKTNAPYFRLGCDYNFANDLRSGNRVFGGLRYAFTSFDFDVDGPPVTDPVWGTQSPFIYKGVHGAARWAEIVFGLEAKIWKFFHLGWSVRYRVRLSEKQSPVGGAWYIPGYGRNDSHALGGTFNIIFDI